MTLCAVALGKCSGLGGLGSGGEQKSPLPQEPRPLQLGGHQATAGLMAWCVD